MIKIECVQIVLNLFNTTRLRNVFIIHKHVYMKFIKHNFLPKKCLKHLKRFNKIKLNMS